MQAFNHRPLAPPRLTEKSPLFKVMMANSYQKSYMELASEDEEHGDQKLPNAVPAGGDFKAPYSTIVFVASLLVVFVIFVISSVKDATTRVPVWKSDDPPPITPQYTKMTLIRTETIGNAKSVRVVTNGPDGVGPEQVLAEGVYVTDVKHNGWNHLRAHMPNIPLTDDYDYFAQYFMQWEAMGFLEGYVTCSEMQAYYINLYHGLFDGGDIVPEAVDFLVENHDWVRAQAEANWRTSDYWLSVKALLVQMTGMLNGLREGCPSAAGGPSGFDVYSSASLRTLHNNPTLVNLLLLNANGDLYQIAAKYNQENQPVSNDDDTTKYTNPPPPTNISTLFDDDNHVKSMGEVFSPKVIGRGRGGRHKVPSRNLRTDADGHPIAELHTYGRYGSDHCSALIRLLPDNSDVLFTHNTWDDFQNAAPRIFKQYSFPQPTYRKPQGVSDNPDDRTTPTAAPTVLAADNYRRAESVVSSEVADTHLNQHQAGKRWKSQPAVETTPEPSVMGTSSPTSISNTKTYSVASSQMIDIHFSSSPGFLTSVDDFYTISGNGNMAVIETSLDIYDQTLLTQIHYDSVLSWMRVRVANQLATDGESWSRLFAMYHSGTYVNQWMVVDYVKFTSGEEPKDDSGLLTILEEMPGYIFWSDQTNFLKTNGFWASFNDAFYPVVRQVSGADLMCEMNPNYCYNSDPRHLIFDQRAPNVKSIDDLKALIRYNNWEVDPLSHNDSCSAISCRMDLEPEFNNQYPFGALDAKLSSIMLASRLHNPAVVSIPTTDDGSQTSGASHTKTTSFQPTIWAVMGPTHDDQPVFCWDAFADRRDARDKPFSTVGHPECFDYDWITLPPPRNINDIGNDWA